MGRSRKPFCCHRNRYLNIMTCSFLLLLMPISLQLICHAQARSISKLHETTKNIEEGKEEEGVEMVMRSLIGSRPPRCERRCKSCGHCEAVQVPVVPQVKRIVPRIKRSRRTHFTAAAARGDDISNYKPMTWKCKCGDTFFNP